MSRLDTLEPAFKIVIEKLLIDLESRTGLSWAVTSARRTISEQNALYQQGRTKPGPVVTKAQGGQSAHNFGLAVDLCPFKDGGLYWAAPDDVWHAMAEIAKEYGLTPGYYFKSFKDMPHLEASNWKTAQAAWKAGKLEVA